MAQALGDGLLGQDLEAFFQLPGISGIGEHPHLVSRHFTRTTNAGVFVVERQPLSLDLSPLRASSNKIDSMLPHGPDPNISMPCHESMRPVRGELDRAALAVHSTMLALGPKAVASGHRVIGSSPP